MQSVCRTPSARSRLATPPCAGLGTRRTLGACVLGEWPDRRAPTPGGGGGGGSGGSISKRSTHTASLHSEHSTRPHTTRSTAAQLQPQLAGHLRSGPCADATSGVCCVRRRASRNGCGSGGPRGREGLRTEEHGGGSAGPLAQARTLAHGGRCQAPSCSLCAEHQRRVRERRSRAEQRRCSPRGAVAARCDADPSARRRCPSSRGPSLGICLGRRHAAARRSDEPHLRCECSAGWADDYAAAAPPAATLRTRTLRALRQRGPPAPARISAPAALHHARVRRVHKHAPGSSLSPPTSPSPAPSPP
jgi:hypothetical protein